MIKEILSDIYQLQIPLPGNPLRTLNSYLIKGDKRVLLVDTGFNWPACKEALIRGVQALGIDWSVVDFFITHVHGDHSGLVYNLASQDSKVYCSRTDADIMRSCMNAPYWLTLNKYFIQNGYPPEKIKNQWETMGTFISGSDINFTYVQDGDIIEVGGFHLVCVSTPGHSPGHMCLYDPEHKFLISGDHILASITSNITSWSGTGDFLGQYLASLDKIDSMDVNLVLPGHRQLIHDCHGRLTELKNHHENRLAEILGILQEGAKNAYQVASFMHWDLAHYSWEEVSSYQQWFATGEAISHLDHLVSREKVLRTEENHEFLYQLL